MRSCPKCGHTENTRKALRKHKINTHGHVVCTCNMKFQETKHMEQHKKMSRKHLGLGFIGQGTSGPSASFVGGASGNFVCTCGKSFRQSKSMDQHREMSRKHKHDSATLRSAGAGLSAAFGGLRLSSGSDLQELRQDNLESFVADHIQADGSYLRCCGDVIDSLVKVMQDTIKIPEKLRPRRIIKSGSLGKGTAVKGRSDIDLVLMLNEYERVGDLMRDMDDVLKSLQRYIEHNTSARHQKTTRYSVQVELKCHSGHSHDVDVLPTVDLRGRDVPLARIYEEMGHVSTDMIHEYSVTLAPEQLDIISGLPTKVKNLIKLIKFWKDTELKDKYESEMPSFAEKRYGKPNWPSSYALELVVLNAWTEANEPVGFDMTRALHAVLTSLVNHREFKVVLRRQMKYSNDMIRSRTPPYIMDPANPYNDMYHGLVGGQAFDWDRVVPEARRWLSKPLFYGVSGTKHNWK